MHFDIAIIDDAPDVRLLLRGLCAEWAGLRGNALRFSEFESAEDYLFSGGAEDILLLDIEMKAMSGVDLAKKLREGCSSVQIIFITGYPDYMADGYEVQALHYLLKPVAPEKLFSVLDRAADNLRALHPTYLLETKDGPVRFYADEVLYLEARAHHTELAAKNAVYELAASISQLEARLGDGFVRCHRSYLVNLRWIARLTRAEVVLDDGRSLPLSRRLADEVRRRFIAYYRGDADAPV